MPTHDTNHKLPRSIEKLISYGHIYGTQLDREILGILGCAFDTETCSHGRKSSFEQVLMLRHMEAGGSVMFPTLELTGRRHDFMITDDLRAPARNRKTALLPTIPVTLRPRIAGVSVETITSVGEG